MNLRKILDSLEILNNFQDLDQEINDIFYDSRLVQKGSLFVCLDGYYFDGHRFALDAVRNGASAVVCEKDLGLENQILVKNSREALSKISANFFDHPSRKLKVIAITGTKGKTTVSSLISKILNDSGRKTAQIGTLGAIFGDELVNTRNTTPESFDLQKLLKHALDLGFEYAVIEASSVGLKSHRLGDIDIDYGVFTNISSDHIGPNEHDNFDDYINSKSMLFKMCKKGFVNIDDPLCERVIRSHSCSISTYGFSKDADICCSDYEFCDSKFGSIFFVKNDKFILNIPGRYNIYNALSSIAVCSEIGVKYDTMRDSIENCSIAGRSEVVFKNSYFTIMVDYAHNSFGLENAINSLREYNPKRIVTLFGAGGNRSKDRRAPMGRVSGTLSDLTVITSDNPRFEDPLDIIQDIEKGICETSGKFVVIPDRKEAIKYCIDNAEQGDLILLAGKGHECYQEINGVLYDFDERKVVNSVLHERGIC